MKKTLKMMLVILLGMAAMGAMSGCKKEVLYQYKCSFEDVYYLSGNESTAKAFMSEINAVLKKFNGKPEADPEVISEISKVVMMYNFNVIKGTLYLKKSPMDESSWITIKSFTMKYNFYYSPGQETEKEFVEIKCFIQNEDY